MLYHTVLFQFPEQTSRELIDDVLHHLRAMEAIPAVRSIVVGANTMPVVDGWTHGMTIVFDSQASMMGGFAGHPMHQAVVADQIPRFARYMAMDVNSDPTEKGLRGDDS